MFNNSFPYQGIIQNTGHIRNTGLLAGCFPDITLKLRNQPNLICIIKSKKKI